MFHQYSDDQTHDQAIGSNVTQHLRQYHKCIRTQEHDAGAYHKGNAYDKSFSICKLYFRKFPYSLCQHQCKYDHHRRISDCRRNRCKKGTYRRDHTQDHHKYTTQNKRSSGCHSCQLCSTWRRCKRYKSRNREDTTQCSCRSK